MRVETPRQSAPSMAPWLRMPDESTTTSPEASLKVHCPTSPGVLLGTGAAIASLTCSSVRATFHTRTSSIIPSHAALPGCAPMQRSALGTCSASISSSLSALAVRIESASAPLT